MELNHDPLLVTNLHFQLRLPVRPVPPLGLHLTLIGYIHAHVERTATVGLQAKTASAMPVCPPETRTFS